MNFFKVLKESFTNFQVLSSRCPPRLTNSNSRPVPEGKLISKYLMTCCFFSFPLSNKPIRAICFNAQFVNYSSHPQKSSQDKTRLIGLAFFLTAAICLVSGWCLVIRRGNTLLFEAVRLFISHHLVASLLSQPSAAVLN